MADYRVKMTRTETIYVAVQAIDEQEARDIAYTKGKVIDKIYNAWSYDEVLNTSKPEKTETTDLNQSDRNYLAAKDMQHLQNGRNYLQRVTYLMKHVSRDVADEIINNNDVRRFDELRIQVPQPANPVPIGNFEADMNAAQVAIRAMQEQPLIPPQPANLGQFIDGWNEQLAVNPLPAWNDEMRFEDGGQIER